MKTTIQIVAIALVGIIATCSCTGSRICTGTVSKSVINKYKPAKNNFVKAKYHLN